MLPLAGYADRLSVRPGETISFKVAGDRSRQPSASVVRVVCSDPNPAGLGIRLEPVGAEVSTAGTVEPRTAPLGSFGRVDMKGRLGGLADATVIVTLMATRLAGQAQPILSWRDPASGDGLSLLLGPDGRIGVAGAASPAWGGKVAIDAWARIVVRYEAGARRLRIGVEVLGGAGMPAAPMATVEVAGFDARPAVPGGLLIAAAAAGEEVDRFSGRIERPMIFSRALPDAEVARAAAGESVPGLVACWDFAQRIETNDIVDTGPDGLHGRLVNTPTRAMTGSNWTGREMSWRHAPQQYGAIHFHEDDLDDCHWPTTHTWTVPAGMRSGQYALVLEAGEARENIPFFVVPPKGTATARVAVLVSTFTYTVYGNHARPEWMLDAAWREAWKAQAAAWKGYPYNPGEHRDYGLSTYNFHTDGSGIALVSWHRPMLNVRIGYLTYPYPDIRASGLRHYPADSHLTAWLEAKGYDYDIVTDWELHTEGHALLARYPVVLTGTHPEYHTREMIDALTAYRDGGGRFCYLGGNGFYWKIALSPEKDGVIEIRRGEGGIRAWAAEPGEYYNQLDGEYGGLWRRNGRPPQKLTGVGFTAQGNFVGSYYRVQAQARRDPRVAWALAGIDDDQIGGFGLSGHGAAGFELDRTDKHLGTPGHAVVIASSENHPPDAPWVLVPEEQLTHIVTLAGQPARELIRADLTFFETAGGKGAVFSTGSITFCGSLPVNSFDNNVSRLLQNVLDRFLDPAPFAMPAA